MLAICLIFIFVCCSQEAHYQHNININATLSTSNINKNNISPPHAESKTSEIFTDWHTGAALGTELMHQSGRFSSSSLTDMINSNYPTPLRQDWEIETFFSRSWKIHLIANIFLLKLVLCWQSGAWWCGVFLAWMILRLNTRDDNTLNLTCGLLS